MRAEEFYTLSKYTEEKKWARSARQIFQVQNERETKMKKSLANRDYVHT